MQSTRSTLAPTVGLRRTREQAGLELDDAGRIAPAIRYEAPAHPPAAAPPTQHLIAFNTLFTGAVQALSDADGAWTNSEDVLLPPTLNERFDAHLRLARNAVAAPANVVQLGRFFDRANVAEEARVNPDRPVVQNDVVPNIWENIRVATGNYSHLFKRSSPETVDLNRTLLCAAFELITHQRYTLEVVLPMRPVYEAFHARLPEIRTWFTPMRVIGGGTPNFEVSCCMHSTKSRAKQFACQHSVYQAVYETIGAIAQQRQDTELFVPNAFTTDRFSEFVMRYAYLSAPMQPGMDERPRHTLPHYVCQHSDNCTRTHIRAAELAVRLMDNVTNHHQYRTLVESGLLLEENVMRTVRLNPSDAHVEEVPRV